MFFSALLLVAKLIWMLTLSLAFVYHTMDELEQIRTRKIAEMMNRPEKPQGSSRSAGPAVLTDANFDAAIKANSLVVVDCWAAWCYPCRMIAPIVEELASEYGSVATFGKLDVDENPSTAMRYGIQSIPTILIIKNGVEVDRVIGVVPKMQIETVLKKYL
jgi:thioredoxin 1